MYPNRKGRQCPTRLREAQARAAAWPSMPLAFMGIGFPLLSQKQALHWPQHEQWHNNNQYQAHNRVNPDGRTIGRLQPENRTDAHHTGKQHHKPGCAIARVSKAIGKPATAAFLSHGEIAIKQPPPRAAGALASQARLSRRKVGIEVL